MYLQLEIASQLLDLAGKAKQVQWCSFVEQMSSYIIDSYNGDNKTAFYSNWKKKFKDVSRKLKLDIIRDEKQVDVWTEKITPHLFINTTVSKSSSHVSSTSSLSYQRLLSENDKKLLSSVHQNINHKWVLSSGTVVEDIIYKHVKDFKVEHPLHSYVLSIDNQLNSMFTADEIKEIEKESGFTDMSKSLPESLANILMKLKGKNDFKSIDQTFQEMRYDRRTQPSEYWCRNSILNHLDLFIESDNFTPFVTEQDLLNDMYGFLKSTKNISKTTTETGCQSSASKSNKNSQRELGTNQQLVRQANGDCSDLTFKYLSSELGCVEIGLVDHGANGTKELQELKLKSPKMMRSFCKQMIDQYKIKANKIKIVSFIINGSFITAQVMTFTKGSVGILFSSPRLKMPENISQIPALLPPILALVYNCTLIIKETAQLLKDEILYLSQKTH
ncbi:hypothetical protein G6F56_002231 [Rhizopus delemar]|nr:hypothetical protein G6F56_002231 [Rhizopus delemar]